MILKEDNFATHHWETGQCLEITLSHGGGATDI